MERSPNFTDDDPVLMCAWRLGRGVEHMRMQEMPALQSDEFAALERFWQGLASLVLTEADVREFLRLAKLIPDFPTANLRLAEQELDRLSQAG